MPCLRLPNPRALILLHMTRLERSRSAYNGLVALLRLLHPLPQRQRLRTNRLLPGSHLAALAVPLLQRRWGWLQRLLLIALLMPQFTQGVPTPLALLLFAGQRCRCCNSALCPSPGFALAVSSSALHSA